MYQYKTMNILNEISGSRSERIQILHGTDWWTDCDDVAALRLLLRAHKSGAIRLLGIGLNSVMDYSVASVSAFCMNEGLRIPIGIDKKAFRDGSNCKYQKLLAAYPHYIENPDDCPDAYKLYRQILSEIDGKADIIDVGFPQIIMQLLKSKPDEFSDLTGIELTEKKIGHIWLMAGKWDEPDGLEYNLSAYPVCSEAGAYICENCPVPITFVGFEIGVDVITGDKLPHEDILWKAFNAHGSGNGRSSWDPITALTAILQNESDAGFSVIRGRAVVDQKTGRNNFFPDEKGRHYYVKRLYPAQWYADRINSVL